jgi:predicted lipoprotein with Yx(FWY)xxD motif
MSRNSITTRRVSALTLSALLLIGADACSKRRSARDTTAAAAGGAADSAAAVVAVAPAGAVPVVELRVADKPGVGLYIADSAGRALYIVEAPAGGAAACTGDCATAMQPVTGRATAARGDTAVRAALIAARPGQGGAQQVTYNGQPLYYFRDDRAAGDTRGQGRKEGNASSYLVSPSGQRVGAAGRQGGTNQD